MPWGDGQHVGHADDTGIVVAGIEATGIGVGVGLIDPGQTAVVPLTDPAPISSTVADA